MRHGMVNRKLGRTSAHRNALFRNQLASLIDKERIITTLPKAKELRPQIERLITLAQTDSVHNRRQAVRVVARDAWSRSCSTRSARASPSVRAATPASSSSDPAAATPPRWPSSSSSTSSSRPRRRKRRRPKKAKGRSEEGQGQARSRTRTKRKKPEEKEARQESRCRRKRKRPKSQRRKRPTKKSGK